MNRNSERIPRPLCGGELQSRCKVSPANDRLKMRTPGEGLRLSEQSSDWTSFRLFE